MLVLEENAPESRLRVKPRRVLAVDDDRTALIILEQSLVDLGYEVTAAAGGSEALEYLKDSGALVDVVVLDRRMPEVDGIEVVRRMKADPKLRRIPIIMLTGASEETEIEEGVSAGVFYYLVKPASTALLRTITAAAMREAEQQMSFDGRAKSQFSALKYVDTCRLYVRTLEEATEAAALLSECFPDPARVGDGLLELIVNAVEHGIYGLGFDKKSEVLQTGTVEDYLRPSYDDPAFSGGRAEVVFTRKNGGFTVIITDPGPGFDWKQFLTVNPARAVDSHGRGIAKAANMSFDKVTYNESGNRVVAHISEEVELDW